jgi:hypothetical protein
LHCAIEVGQLVLFEIFAFYIPWASVRLPLLCFFSVWVFWLFASSCTLHPHIIMAAIDADTKGPTFADEQGYDAQDGAKSRVSAKYLGTEGDKAQMRMLGRTQETRRVFTFITILGFGSTLIVTWEVLLTNIGLILINGGTAGMFWGFLFVLIGWILVYLSLSEMASM